MVANLDLKNLEQETKNDELIVSSETNINSEQTTEHNELAFSSKT